VLQEKMARVFRAQFISLDNLDSKAKTSLLLSASI
jgi:hypothetical protein